MKSHSERGFWEVRGRTYRFALHVCLVRGALSMVLVFDDALPNMI